jgi:hypothetical protein
VRVLTREHELEVLEFGTTNRLLCKRKLKQLLYTTALIPTYMHSPLDTHGSVTSKILARIKRLHLLPASISEVATNFLARFRHEAVSMSISRENLDSSCKTPCQLEQGRVVYYTSHCLGYLKLAHRSSRQKQTDSALHLVSQYDYRRKIVTPRLDPYPSFLSVEERKLLPP